jgi:uncharacterized protein (TIGR02266 family)
MRGVEGKMEPGRIRTFIETEFEVRGQRAQGTIKNMSEGGLFVSTTSVPEEGESVNLTFRAPGGKEVTLSGLVWWTANRGDDKRHGTPGFGLRLLNENDDLRRLLESPRSSSHFRVRKVNR